MTVQDTLEKLYKLAIKDDKLRKALLDTKNGENQVINFCRIAGEYGCPMNPYDLIMAGEEAYAEMCRSTNGGGENHPRIKGADDLYSLFIQDISF